MNSQDILEAYYIDAGDVTTRPSVVMSIINFTIQKMQEQEEKPVKLVKKAKK